MIAGMGTGWSTDEFQATGFEIPVMLGGGGNNLGRRTSSKAVQRIAKRADGWLPLLTTPGPAGAAELRASWDRIREMASAYGRDTSRLEMVVVGNVTAKRASRLATARSHIATSWQPAAVARPWTLAITGTGSRWIESITPVTGLQSESWT
jgi:hypothetical protein